MVKLKVIYDAWVEVGKDPRFRGKWLSDEMWYRLMINVFPNLRTLGVDRGKMNQAISKCGSDLGNFETNSMGMFKTVVNSMQDPFAEKQSDGSFPKRHTSLYYVTDIGEPVECPSQGNTSFQGILKDFEVHATRVRQSHRETVNYDSINDVLQAALQERQQGTQQEHGHPASRHLEEQDYWDSSEAKKLFIGDKDSDKSVRDIMENHIATMQHVSWYPEGWRKVVEQHDKDNLCMQHTTYMLLDREVKFFAYRTSMLWII